MYEIRLTNQEDSNDLATLNFKFNEIHIEPQLIVESMRSSSELIAVAILNGDCIGFASAQVFKSFCYGSCQGEITEMYIEEAHRQNGVATKLIVFLEEVMKLKGVKSVKILTGIDNFSALATYKKAGYNIQNETMLSKKI